MSLPKRTPEEWLTVVQVGRPNKTIFTEGNSDARILRIASGFPEDVDFRSADEVDFDPPVNPYIGSNKARVIAIARAYDLLPQGGDLKPIVFDHARCFIDGDFNYLANEENKTKSDGILIVTEFSNLLSCFVTYDWFRSTMLAAFAWEPSLDVWELLQRAILIAFLCRHRNAVDNLNIAAPNLGKYFEIQNQNIAFREGSYLQAYLGYQGQQASDFLSEATAAINMIADHRSLVNSNDLTSGIFGLLTLSKKMGPKFEEANVREIILAKAPTLVGMDASTSALQDWLSK